MTSKLNNYIDLIRVKHWVKNVAVLTPLPFSWLAPSAVFLTPAIVIAFVAFCCAASAIYVLNDLLDRSEDLLHPLKKNRPIASGRVSTTEAVSLASLLIGISLVACWMVGSALVWTMVVSYIILMIGYSLYFKHQPILDVIVIACGFVIRTVAGAAALDVYISPWLIVCTFTLCLFLGFGKRRSEVYAIESSELAARHRPTLSRYSADLLNQLLSTSAGIALVTFLLYIMDSEAQPGQTISFDKRPLLYTFPLVAYGVFRYAMLIESGKVTGPTDILLKDKTILITVFLWMLTSSVIILFEPLKSVLPWS